MSWSADVHRLREQIKSEREKQRELDGRGDYDLHRFRNVRLTEMNVNVLSVCSSTYCLGERRSMELSIMLDLT